jgi:hypothetical protein
MAAVPPHRWWNKVLDYAEATSVVVVVWERNPASFSKVKTVEEKFVA